MNLGEYISNYRREHNLSIREFAKMCGLSHVQIIRMETGKNSNGEPFTPSWSSLEKVAKGMGVRIEDVVRCCKNIDIDYATDITFMEPDGEYIIGKIISATPEQLSKIRSYVDFVMQS